MPGRIRQRLGAAEKWVVRFASKEGIEPPQSFDDEAAAKDHIRRILQKRLLPSWRGFVDHFYEDPDSDQQVKDDMNELKEGIRMLDRRLDEGEVWEVYSFIRDMENALSHKYPWIPAWYYIGTVVVQTPKGAMIR